MGGLHSEKFADIQTFGAIDNLFSEIVIHV